MYKYYHIYYKCEQQIAKDSNKRISNEYSIIIMEWYRIE